MNIPKKLELKLDTNIQGLSLNAMGQQMIIDKINELIDYLQAKEEASKKDKYLCYTCNQWGIVGKHKCEASKCICPENSWRSDCPYPHTNRGKNIDLNPDSPQQEESRGECVTEENPEKLCNDCKTVHRVKWSCPTNPPEHEWVYGFEDGTIIDLNRIKGKELADLLDTRFVSKEKIKREIVREAKWSYDNNEYNWSPTHLLNSLGLGD